MLFLICCTGFLFRQCSWRWIAHFLFRGSGSDLNQTSKVFIQLQIPSIITFHNKSLYYASIHCLKAYKSQLRFDEPAGRSSTQVSWFCLHAWSASSRPFLIYSHSTSLALTLSPPDFPSSALISETQLTIIVLIHILRRYKLYPAIKRKTCKAGGENGRVLAI